MLSNDIRKYVIAPSLHIIDKWSPSAELLVYATGMIETKYNNLMQIGEPENGGIGFWQMQPETYKDHRTWITNNRNYILQNSISGSCYYLTIPTDPMTMMTNLRFGAIMCRIHYLRVPEPIPSQFDMIGLANYYKKYYNTELGKAKIDDVIEVFKEILANGKGQN